MTGPIKIEGIPSPKSVEPCDKTVNVNDADSPMIPCVYNSTKLDKHVRLSVLEDPTLKTMDVMASKEKEQKAAQDAADKKRKLEKLNHKDDAVIENAVAMKKRPKPS